MVRNHKNVEPQSNSEQLIVCNVNISIDTLVLPSYICLIMRQRGKGNLRPLFKFMQCKVRNKAYFV